MDRIRHSSLNLGRVPKSISSADVMCALRGSAFRQFHLGRLPARQSGGAAPSQYGGDGLPQDLQIEGERPVLDVAEVEADGVIAL